jgi:hypothetical protein
MTDEIRRQKIRQALVDPNRCDHEIFACGLPLGHEGKHRTIASVRGEVRVFRYTKPNGPVYRVYPDGRVTRNSEEIDPSNLEHCESSVREGAMTEGSEFLPETVTEWGRRWPDGTVRCISDSRTQAEDSVFPGTEVVRREVGPWTAVQS